MAFLFANSRQMELADAFSNIEEMKRVVEDRLRNARFSDVVVTPSEVAGNRNGVRISILHLHIGDRSFWEVVMAGGDLGDVTRGTVDEVVKFMRLIGVPDTGTAMPGGPF